jgi:alginate O-acetyltransferase complex protein AlgJ
MKKILILMEKYMLLVASLLFLTIPFVTAFSGNYKDSISLEKRELATLPKILSPNIREQLGVRVLIQNFPLEFDDYLKDHFPFRNKFVQGANYSRLKYLDINPTPNVIKGENGFYYYNIEEFRSLSSGSTLFSESELENWKTTLEKRNNFVNSKGGKYYVFISPIKATIYPENLPKNYPQPADKKKTEQLVEYMDKNSEVKIVYFKESLLEEKRKNNAKIYQSTDSHWNLNGAYIGYVDIMSKIKNDFPETEIYSKDDFEISTRNDLISDLSMAMGIGSLLREKDFPTYSPKPNLPIVTEINKGVIPYNLDKESENTFFVEYKNSNTKLPKAVVFHSSYHDMLSSFTNLNYSEAYYYKYTVDFNKKIIEEKNPNIVIQEFSEQSLFITPRDNL